MTCRLAIGVLALWWASPCATHAMAAEFAQQRSSPASAPQPPPQAGRGSDAFPGDATSIQEVYESWTVLCAQPEGKRICSLSQQQTDKDSRQRVLALELTATSADKADGTLLLPFGLAVDKDVTLQVDGAALGSAQHFRTCVQSGCVVKMTLDAPTIGMLKKGTALAVKVTTADGQPLTFTLLLKGFSSAFDRTTVLGKS